MRGDENSLRWYVRNSCDVLLQGVRVTGKIKKKLSVKMNSRHLGTMS